MSDYDLLVVSPKWRDFDPRLDAPIIPVAMTGALKVPARLRETEQRRGPKSSADKILEGLRS